MNLTVAIHKSIDAWFLSSWEFEQSASLIYLLDRCSSVDIVQHGSLFFNVSRIVTVQMINELTIQN